MILEKVDNVKINPSLIQPLTEIKSLGNFKVTISLHSEVETNIVIETAAKRKQNNLHIFLQKD